MKMKGTVVLSLFVVASLILGSSAMAADFIADGGSAATAIDIGDVTITIGPTQVCVDISVTGGWEIMETHVAIVTDLDDIDMSKGGPKVGKLPLGEDFAEPYPSSAGPYCATLDAADLEPLDQVIVAVHAEVRILMVADDPLTLEDETEYRYESAWAAAAEANEATGQFEGSNWATYVTVTVPEPVPVP